MARTRLFSLALALLLAAFLLPSTGEAGKKGKKTGDAPKTSSPPPSPKLSPRSAPPRAAAPPVPRAAASSSAPARSGGSAASSSAPKTSPDLYGRALPMKPGQGVQVSGPTLKEQSKGGRMEFPKGTPVVTKTDGRQVAGQGPSAVRPPSAQPRSPSSSGYTTLPQRPPSPSGGYERPRPVAKRDGAGKASEHYERPPGKSGKK